MNMKTTKPLLILAAGFLSAMAVAAPDFSELTQLARDGQIGSIKAIVIAHEGEIVYEEYFRGTEADTLHLLNSVTKSIGATLLGILNRQGRLDTEERVSLILSQYEWNSDSALIPNANLSVENILTQRHGLDWDEWDTDYRDPENIMTAMIQSPDWYYFVLSRPRLHPPGEVFAYSTGVSTLMSGIIRARTGMNPQTFARSFLFSPLGIERVHFEGYSPQGIGNGMTQWPFGDAPLGWAWWLTARDMLTLGELYRNGGVHEGTRVIDTQWIRDSWRTYSNSANTELFAGTPGRGYGYQWWLLPVTDGRGRTFQMAYANGWGRQYIMVFPDLDLTVVTTSDDYDYEGNGIGFALRNVILEAFDMTLDHRFTGSWYDPAMSGQGISLEILEHSNQAVAYWFTFDNEGQQQWFVGQGPLTGEQAELTIYEVTGGYFLDPTPVQTDPVGTAQLRFSTCDAGEMQFEMGEASGTYSLSRLTGECASPLLQ
jgi:CubicO group peptidase (beta-lactamase class C family)